MSKIAVIGGGIAGMHLSLMLQQHNVPVTLYTDKTPDQQRASRLPNNTVRFGTIRAYEHALGVDYWQDCNLYGINVYLAGTPPLTFQGNFDPPASNIDIRIYLAVLLEAFMARGGEVIFGQVQSEDVVRLSDQYDLMVVASGRGSLIEMFPRLEQYSPFPAPLRTLCSAFYHGIANPDPHRVTLTVAPGLGEITQAPFHAADGLVSVMAFECIPGQEWDRLLLSQDHSLDPEGFNQIVLDILSRYAPRIYERVDQSAFGLTRPLDLLQGAITPTVRQGYVDLQNGKYAVAIGDVNILNDPILAQGGNLAAYSAWTLGQAILEDVAFDEAFCRSVEQRIWSRAEAVCNWTNQMLLPPTPHVIQFLFAAAQHPGIANDYARNFDDPEQNWNILASPERTIAYLQQAGIPIEPMMVGTP